MFIIRLFYCWMYIVAWNLNLVSPPAAIWKARQYKRADVNDPVRTNQENIDAFHRYRDHPLVVTYGK